ncbi:MAG: hypothetical protein ACXACR_09055 [Candidatus Hodarchaeales archaeon]|jgi:hypothetical protein
MKSIHHQYLTFDPKTTDDLIASWESNDNDSDGLLFYVSWYLGGSFNRSIQTSAYNATITSGNTTKGQQWSFNVIAHDGTVNSTETSLLYNITIQNSKPTATNPGFNTSSPADFVGYNAFNITYTFVDLDGDFEDSFKLNVTWFVDWIYTSTYDNETTIYSTNTTAGQVWSYILQVYDGEEYSDYIPSATGIVISGGAGNIEPVVQYLNITPLIPTTQQSLTANYTYSDSDGPDIPYAYEIRWYMNGTLQSAYNNSLTVPSVATMKGQQWNFSMRVFDGVDWSTPWKNSSLYNITNTPPELISDSPTLTINPITTDNLVATWSSNDADSDTLIFIIKWYIGGIENTTFENNTFIGSGNTTKGEEWNFTVQAYDGESYSSVVSLGSLVTILNSAPEVDNLIITTSPKTTDDLVASWDYDDLDNDQRNDSSAFIIWYKNGQAVIENTTTVGLGNTTKNQVWWYSIKVYDGQTFSTTKYSQHVEILNSVPINTSDLPSLSMTPNKINGLVLTHSTIIDSLTDPDGDTIELAEIRWYKDGTLQSDLNDSLSVSGSRITRGDTWKYTIRPFDGSEYGSVYISDDIVILNSIPVISLAYFAESDVRTIHNLTANYQYFDADGDNVSISDIQWYRSTDGGFVFNHNSTFDGNISLPSTATTKNEFWYFEIQITDGFELSVWGQSILTIEIKNSEPYVDPFSISLAGGTNTSEMLYLLYSSYDDDGEDESGTVIKWRNSDLDLVQNNLLNLSSTNTKAGQRWWVEITPNDGESDGTVVNSADYGFSLIIGNSPPSVNQSNIAVRGEFNATEIPGTSFSTLFDLVLHYNASDIDGDQGVLSYDLNQPGKYALGSTYRWFRNRSGVVSLISSLNDETTVPSHYTQKNDEWWVEVEPRDFYGDFGLPVNSSAISIGNTEPLVDEFSWNDLYPTTTDDLEFEFLYFDWDNDPQVAAMTLILWFKNGVLIPGTENSTLLTSDYFIKNDNISVIIRPYDGKFWAQI